MPLPRVVAGLHRVRDAALLAQRPEHGPLQDGREDRGRGVAAHVGVPGEHPGRAGDEGGTGGKRRRDTGRGPAYPIGKFETQPGRHRRAGHPQRRVLPGEEPVGPAAQAVRGDRGQAHLAVAADAEVAGAVPVEGEQVVGGDAAAALFGAQDLLLGGEPVQRQVVQGLADAVEERDDVGVTALGVEVGDLVACRAVVVVVGDAEREQRQVLDEVGDAVPGQRLVGEPDAEGETGPGGAVGAGEQPGDAVDLETFDHDAVSRAQARA